MSVYEVPDNAADAVDELLERTRPLRLPALRGLRARPSQHGRVMSPVDQLAVVLLTAALFLGAAALGAVLGGWSW